jgi:hypothetical protein
MGCEFDREKLEAALSESVIVLQLRDILTKTGIPSDETVTLRIQQDDDIIVSVEVPRKSPEITIPQLATNFAEELGDSLNRAEALTGLLSALPNSNRFPDGTTKIPFKFIFDIGILAIVAQDVDTQDTHAQFSHEPNIPRQQNTAAYHICPGGRIC